VERIWLKGCSAVRGAAGWLGCGYKKLSIVSSSKIVLAILDVVEEVGGGGRWRRLCEVQLGALLRRLQLRGELHG
jgi:hypothetical protein